MAPARVLIANRGEIAVRIVETLRSEGVESAWPSTRRTTPLAPGFASLITPRSSPHRRAAPTSIRRPSSPRPRPAAPPPFTRYGFLSENAALRALRGRRADFPRPTPAQLRALGSKTEARSLARSLGVPCCPVRKGPRASRTPWPSESPPRAPMLKAARGRWSARPVAVEDHGGFHPLFPGGEKAFWRWGLQRAGAPGAAPYRSADPRRRPGGVVHLWERECTLQRRRQKLLEVAPSPTLDGALRQRILDAALSLAQHLGYRSLGTFEFLVDPSAPEGFAFMEANPRLQVEHTATEMITGLDLVACQLAIGAGATLDHLGLGETPAYRGFAAQARVNLETLDEEERAARGHAHGPHAAHRTGGSVDGWEKSGSSFPPLRLLTGQGHHPQRHGQLHPGPGQAGSRPRPLRPSGHRKHPTPPSPCSAIPLCRKTASTPPTWNATPRRSSPWPKP